MDKLSSRRNKTNLTKRNSKPDGDELLALFTRNLVDELSRSTNKCMQEYKALIKGRSNARHSVYQFHTKPKKFKKPSATGNYTIMSTITEEISLESLISESMQCYSGSSKNYATNSMSRSHQKTKLNESTQTRANDRTREKRTEVSDVPQQRLKMRTAKTSERTSTKKPYSITRRCK